MKQYVNYIRKYQKPLLVILILINILSIIGVTKIRINTNFDMFTVKDSVYKENMDEMNSYFESSNQLMILVETDDISIMELRKIHDLQTYLINFDYITTVNGPVINGDDLEKEVTFLKDVVDTNENSIYKDFQSVLRVDNKIYFKVLAITHNNFTRDNLKEVEKYLAENSIKYYMSGDVYNEYKIIDYITAILGYLPPLALSFIFLVFFSQMKSLKATILSVLPAGLGALWTMGLIGWLGHEVSIVAVIAPIFTIVIGSADGLHFISHIQDTRKEGLNNIDSIVETLKMVGVPMIITTVTSVAGFLSLLVMNTNSIYDFVFFASIGITFAGIATWCILPLILVGNTKLKLKDRENNVFKFIYILISKSWGIVSISVLALLIIFSLVSINKVNNEFNMIMMYKENTDVFRNYNKIITVTGKNPPVYAYVKFIDNTETEYSSSKVSPFIRKLKESENKFLPLIKELKDSEYVESVNSIYDPLTFASMIFNGDSNSINPLSDEQINQIYSKVIYNNSYKHLINPEESTIRLFIYPRDLNNNTIDEIEKIVNKSNNLIGLNVKMTGLQYLMKDLNEDMNSNLMNSIILAIALVFILLLISLRNLRVTLYSLIPIFASTIIVYGFMGLSGIPLNIVTVIIFSISIGVGIDYSVHFSSIYLKYYKENQDKLLSAKKAYEYTSTPIIANGLGIAIGLSALLLSPLKIHLYVSTLMWVSMIVSVFLSLSILPTLLIGNKDN